MSQATEKLKSTTAIRGVFKNWIHFLFGDNFEIVDNFDDNIFGSSLKKTVQSLVPLSQSDRSMILASDRPL